MSGSSEVVELVDHDPSWAELYEQERGRLAGIFGEQAVGIEHIGSTSVPGLCSKPIVDVLVGVRELELSEEQVDAMRGLGTSSSGSTASRADCSSARSRGRFTSTSSPTGPSTGTGS